jgi:hypothetical protein
MEERKIKKCEVGYYVEGASPIHGTSLVFVETLAEAEAIMAGGPAPTEVIRVGYSYLWAFTGMVVPRDTLVTEQVRMRYNSDEEFKLKLKNSAP